MNSRPKNQKNGGVTRSLALLGLGLTLAMASWAILTVLAHNVDQRMNWMFYDSDTLDQFNVRAGAGQNLIQVGDELGVILKATPEPSGATTGVGDYIDFYVPIGTQVVDLGYALPDGAGGFQIVPMKGQSIMPIGDGPVGAEVTSELIGLTLGPNITGQTEDSVSASGLHRGTLAGVYADTGIFYSTDPSTAWQSWADHPSGNFSITNNRGEVVFPNNQWDAEQLLAYGSKSPSDPIVDPDGRGSTPWGLGSAVAGSQSGYAWEFDWELWEASAKTAADMRDAADGAGPWQRIAYPGAQASLDQAGLDSSELGFAGTDASTLGTVVSPATPLPPTVSTTDSTSPKVVRWSVGQLSFGRPEYVFVKILINDLTAADADGCFLAFADVFGGDAGGEQGGKDHLWRYYDPTTTTLNACAAIRKTASKDVVANDEIFQYTIEFWNTSASLTLTNVEIQDTLPGEVAFISAFPLQDSGPNPLLWTFPSVAPGEKVELTVTVRARSSGVLAVNSVSFCSDENVCGGNEENVFLGSNPVLIVSKSVTPGSTTAGGSVQYTLLTRNVGAGPSGNPVTAEDYLPTGFTYASLQSVTINGANGLTLTSVDSSDPTRPIFDVSEAIQADEELEIVFTAQVGASVLAGSYCNQFTASHRDPVLGDDVTINTGSEACVTVGGAAVGDKIYRDWDNDGVQDADEEGLPGITMELQHTGCTAGVNCPTTVTDSAGAYSFVGLTSGTYTVAVLSGIPAGYAASGDPDEVGQCVTCDEESTVTLADEEERFDLDFGYFPGGSGSIGDLVFEDIGNDGTFNGSDVGIDAVTVTLYEDSDSSGTVSTYDTGPDLQIGGGDDTQLDTAVTGSGGFYAFATVMPGLYYVDVNDLTLPAGLALSGGSDPSALINLSEGETYLLADFGYTTIAGKSIVGDTVFYDADGDGRENANEVGIGGVRVWLDTNDNAVFDAGIDFETTTSADGKYLFTNLDAGTLGARVDTATLPAGFNSTTTTPPLERTFGLATGVTILTMDWGFNAPAGVTASLGDTVFLDVNGNGSQDAGDGGVPEVTIELRDGSNQFVAGTETNTNGNYSFVGLVPDTYTVIVTDLNGALSTLNPSADPDESGTCSTCDERSSTTLAAGATDNSLDFGYAPSQGAGSLGDAVWHDLDGDGIFEPNGNDGTPGTFDDEPGFGGVTLQLWVDVNKNGAIDAGDNLIRTTTTDNNGFYVFNGVIPEHYLVTITDKFDVLDTNGDGNLSEWTQTARTDPAGAILTTGSPTDLTLDFGFQAVTPFSISGVTYHDANDSQIFEMPESEIPDVTASLYRDLDSDGILDPDEPRIGRVQTNATGDYLFLDLPTGDYIVAVEPQGSLAEGMFQTTQQSTAGIEAVTIPASNVTDVNFGFNIVPTLAVIDDFRVYLDPDKNAVVEWHTIAEIGTAGFHLERENSDSGEYLRLNSELLPALLDTPQGGTYRFLDPGVSKNEKHTYRLIELEADGNLRKYGPYDIKVHKSGPVLTSPPFERVANPDRDDPVKISQKKEKRKKEKEQKEKEKKVKFSGQIAVRILTSARGMYFVSAEQIADVTGVRLKDTEKAIDKTDLLLSNLGREVAYLPLKGGSGLYFFAEAVDSNYSDHNIYWLTSGKGSEMKKLKAKKVKKAGPLSQARVTEHFEQNLSPVPFLTMNPESDYWHWNYLRAGFPGESERDYVLSTPAALGSGQAEIRIYMKGATDLAVGNDHAIQLLINGVEVGTTQWDGLAVEVFRARFDQELLSPGNNQMRLISSLGAGVPYSVVWVDSFELDFERELRTDFDSLEFLAGADKSITATGFSSKDLGIFELSNPLEPRFVSDSKVEKDGAGFKVTFKSEGLGSHYFLLGPEAVFAPVALELDAPSDLRKMNNRAEYLVLTPVELSDGAQALADFRSAEYSTAVVDLQDIYDEFNYGLPSPLAIREFLGYAHENWKVPPQLVVFAGKGSYDYKDILGLGTNVFPIAMAPTPWGLFASDIRLLDFDDDGVPEIAGGRIPALSSDDLLAYLSKLENQQFLPAAAGSKVLMVSDDADAGGDFPASSDLVAQGAAPEVDILKLYHQTGTDGSATSQALLAQIQSGIDFVNYLGHGAVVQLGQENFLNSSQVASLQNSRLPILAALTCAAGNGSYPGLNSLLEELLAHDQGGIIAGVGSSSLSLNPQAVQLNRVLIEGLYGTAPEDNLGASFKKALEALRDAGGFRFVLESYSITGDPAVRPR